MDALETLHAAFGAVLSVPDDDRLLVRPGRREGDVGAKPPPPPPPHPSPRRR
jgi:hypothetical protein